MILTADDLADFQVRIVGAGSHVVSGHGIAAQQREVFNIVGFLRLGTVHSILKFHGTAFPTRHPEAQNKGFPSGGARIAFSHAQFAHPRISHPLTTFVFLFRIHRARLRRREVAISVAFFKYRLSHPPMQIKPFTLAILFIPSQAQPVQPFKNRIERSFAIAFHIGIVDAQNHGAAVTTCVHPVEDESSGTTNVQITGRRWGKTYSEHENFRIAGPL